MKLSRTLKYIMTIISLIGKYILLHCWEKRENSVQSSIPGDKSQLLWLSCGGSRGGAREVRTPLILGQKRRNDWGKKSLLNPPLLSLQKQVGSRKRMLWVFTVECSSTYAAIKVEMKPCVCKTYREIQFSRLFSCSFVIWTTFYNPKWSSKRMQKNADCPICLKLLVSHLVVIQLHLSKQGHPQCRLVLSHPAMPSDHRLVVLLRKF